jgi:hypothetical protein
MKKGLLTLLVALTALLGVTNANAAAPIIGSIPDVIVGDNEDFGPSDNNFFRFNDAFNLDQLAEDDVTPDADLKWSFDEGDDPPLLTAGTQWYKINGKDPVHLGATAQASHTSVTASHVLPLVGNELRVTSNTASFRDIVFSPTAGFTPFPNPTEPAETNHATGKVVTFYVSDQTYVASKDIFVRTIDNSNDSASSEAFEPFRDDTFSTNGSGVMWVTNGATRTVAALNTLAYEPSTGAYRINVFTTATGATTKRYRFAYWHNQRQDWLPISQVGTSKYVRAKFHVYNSGSPTAADVPNFNLRLSQRFGITSALHILGHDLNGAGNANYVDLKPSTNPSLPSIYRTDFDPMNVPWMTTTAPGPGPQTEEGIQSGFEVFELAPNAQGSLFMTELEIGTYPISALGTPTFSQLMDGVLITNANSATLDKNFNLNPLPSGGSTAIGEFPSSAAGTGTITETNDGLSNGAVTFDTVAVPTDRIGDLERTFYPGAVLAQRMRIAENEQYVSRWHITSTRSTSTQGSLWLKTRTASFGYNVFLQFPGGGTNVNREMVREMLPGVGCKNPDQLVANENGGWYTQLLTTPLDPDIRNDVPGTLLTKMPTFAAASHPARGVEAASGFRDIRHEAIVYDTLSAVAGDNAHLAEVSNFTIDKIETRAYTRVED